MLHLTIQGTNRSAPSPVSLSVGTPPPSLANGITLVLRSPAYRQPAQTIILPCSPAARPQHSLEHASPCARSRILCALVSLCPRSHELGHGVRWDCQPRLQLSQSPRLLILTRFHDRSVHFCKIHTAVRHPLYLAQVATHLFDIPEECQWLAGPALVVQPSSYAHHFCGFSAAGHCSSVNCYIVPGVAADFKVPLALEPCRGTSGLILTTTTNERICSAGEL